MATAQKPVASTGIKVGGIAKPSKSGKVKIAAKWVIEPDGRMLLDFGTDMLTALKHGELEVSSTGKSATPLYITTEALTVERDGVDVEFRAQVNVLAPMDQGAAVRI